MILVSPALNFAKAASLSSGVFSPESTSTVRPISVSFSAWLRCSPTMFAPFLVVKNTRQEPPLDSEQRSCQRPAVREQAVGGERQL